MPASTISHSRFGPTRNSAIRSSGRWVAESPIRCGSGSPSSSRPTRLSIEPLQGQRQVGAALRLGDRVDLVDDHRLDPGEDLARLEVIIR